MKHGIDISYAQGKIDWSKVKTDFVMIKGNTGVNATDKQVFNNAKGCIENNIPFGFYHWCTLNKSDVVTDAISEARDFVSLIKMFPQATLTPALDIEEENKLNLPPDRIESWVHVFEHEMKNAEFDIMIYSYAPWLNANLPKEHCLGHLPLWHAQYPNNFTDESKPSLPNGWSDFKIWQYSAKGRVEGISTDVDLNVMK